MLATAGQAERARAVIITSRIRRGYGRGSCLSRKLMAPRLNVNALAQTLAELMWGGEPLTEPLLTDSISSDEVGPSKIRRSACH